MLAKLSFFRIIVFAAKRGRILAIHLKVRRAGPSSQSRLSRRKALHVVPSRQQSDAERMLRIIDEPIIGYTVGDVVAAGISTLIFVTGHNKHAVEDRFDAGLGLGAALLQKGKQGACDTMSNIVPSHLECLFVRTPGR